MPFKIIRNDITKVKADAIVNSANPAPTYVSGTDRAVYEAAGAEKLLNKRRKIGAIAIGEAAATEAFALPAKYIIHTAGPVWKGGGEGEFESLAHCYDNSLKLACKLHCASIAFPLISTGVYGFPKDKALQIAISAISRFLMEQEMLVILVVFDERSFVLSGKLLQEVQTFVDENYVAKTTQREYADHKVRMAKAERLLGKGLPTKSDDGSAGIEADITGLMNQVEDTFQQRLIKIIDSKGLTDAFVYKKAGLDRKLFSKIRCNIDYKPSKKTVLALALALELDIHETKELLRLAGLALSPGSKFDLIIEYFISKGEYDRYDVNLVLFKYGLPSID